MEFSAPQEIGLDAVALVFPADKKPGQGQLEITLVGVPKDMQESMGNNDAEVMNYVKSTFLGVATPGTRKVERTFLGKKVVGEGQTTTIPSKRELEYFLIPLSDGSKVVVALHRDPALAQDQAEAVMKKVSGSLKEIKK